jgi:hypothetical protein
MTIPLGDQPVPNPILEEEENKKKREAEEKRKAAENAKKGLDPNGNRLKRKNTPQEQKPLITRDPLKGVKDALSTDVGGAILNVVDQGLGTNLEGAYKEAQKRGAPQRAQLQKNIDKTKGSGQSELVKAAAKGIALPLEGIVDTAAKVGDVLQTAVTGGADPKRNPWSQHYENPLAEIVKGPQTPVAKFGAGLLGFGLTTVGISKRLPMAGLKGPGGFIARSAVPGGIANLLLTKADDQNFSTIVRDLDFVSPELEDSFLFGLAINRDDNPFIKTLKTTVEGGLMDPVVDMLMAIKFGRGVTQAAKRAGKSDDEALTEGIKAVAEKAEQLTLDLDAVTANKLPDGPNVTMKQGDLWPQAQEAQVSNTVNAKAEAEARLEALKEDPAADPKEIEAAKKAVDDAEEDLIELEDDLNTDPNGLLPHEKASTARSGNINDVAAQQIAGETNIPKVARRTDIPPAVTRGASSPALAGSDNVLTDAAYKIIASGKNASAATIEEIRKAAPLVDLRLIAKMTGKTLNQTVEQAAKVVDDFRMRESFTNEEKSIMDFLRERQVLTTVKEGSNPEFEILSPQGVIATKALITDTANQIYGLTRNIEMLREADAAGGNQMDRVVDRLVSLMSLHKTTGYFQGYGLRSFQENIDALGGVSQGPTVNAAMKSKDSLTAMKDWAVKIKKLARRGDPDAKEEMDRLVRALVLAGGDPLKTVSFAKVAAKVGTEQAMNAFYNSILSGPITHFRNAVGTGYSTIERPLSILIAGTLKGDPAMRAAAVAGFKGIQDSLGEALSVMKQSFATETSLQVNRKFALQEAQSLKELEALRMSVEANGSVAEKLTLSFIETIMRLNHNPFFSWSGRALVAVDDAFKVLQARGKINMDATYQAHMLGGSNVDAYTQKYLQEYSKKMSVDGEILDADLLEYVERGTFQNDPGELADKVTNLLEVIPGARLMVPFVRTPANLLEYSATHFPLLNKFTGYYRKTMAGSDELLKAELKGREAIGATVAAAAAGLALTGNITGNGPVDREQRSLWLQKHPARSIKIGGKWVSYASLEPLNNILMIVADAVMLHRMGGAQGAQQIVEQMGFSIAAATVDKSYLQGLASLAGILDPKNITNPNAITRGLLAVGNSFIPLAGSRRQLSNALNPYMREVDDELQKMLLAAVPGYALNQPLKINPFTGKPVESLSGGIWNSTIPFRIEDAKDDFVINTLVDSQFEFNDLTKTNADGVKMNAEEQAAFNKALYQTGLKYRLEALFKTEDFKASLAKFQESGGMLAKRESRHYLLIVDEIERSKRAAQARVMANNPRIAVNARLRRQKAAAAASGQNQTAIELQRLIDLNK